MGDSWPIIQKRIHHFRKSLVRTGTFWRDVYHVEENPAGTGHHAHMWQWGDRVGRRDLRVAASRAGMGSFAEVSMVRSPAGAPLPYGLKTVLQAPDEGDAISPAIARFLQINGGRLGHATRGFWRGPDGEPLAGVRAAMRAAGRDGRASDWLLVRESVDQ